MRVVILPAQREAFAKRLTTLNKKCVRFGLAELVAGEPTEVLYRRVDSYDNDGALRSSSWKEHSGKIDGRYTYATFLHITITGPVVKSGDWKVVAKLEALGSGILTLATTGDVAHTAAAHAISQSGPIRCEHCNAKRHRKDSFVVVSADGAYKQVGTTCLKDFTGIDPARALFLAALHTEFSGWDEAERLVGGSVIPSYSSTAVIAASLHAIRAWGWVSSSRARDDNLLSTAQQAVALLNGGGSKEFYAAYDALLDEAKAVEEELLGRDAGGDTFISNSQLLVKDGLVPANRVPFLAAVAQRSIIAKEKAAAPQAKSQPVGVAGEKIEVDLTYIGHHIYQNEWGGGAIIKFVDDSGNQFIWSTSSSLEPFKGREGSKCKCKAGVKRHSEFKEQWQTELTRAKIVFY
jgi:hypothetical protein